MALQRCTACLCASTARRAAPSLATPFQPLALFSSSIALCSEASTSGSSSTAASTSASTSSSPSSSSPPPTPQAKSKSPPPLPRPLGVAHPPSRHTKMTLKQRAESMMNKENRIAERKHLIKEATTGYFEDYHKLRHEGGKLWIAPKTLIQEKAARYFPEIEGDRLVPPQGSKETKVHTSELLKGKISVVAMLSTRISEAHIETYTRDVLGTFKEDPLFQFVQINMQENKLKWALLSLFLASLRRSIPEQYRPTYLVSTDSLEYLKEPMGMTNKHPGYIYLVDENCKIRWAAVSSAQTASSSADTQAAQDKTPSDAPQPVDEVQALASCIHVLLQRLRERKP